MDKICKTKVERDKVQRLRDNEYIAYQASLDGITDNEYNKLVNIKAIELNCKYKLSGYKYVNGYPTHNTELGNNNIKKLFGGK